jgi:hypothetical protein
MFFPGEQVLCVDDTHPNPVCSFPNGYVVRGHVYTVIGISPSGGVQIAGLPVFNLISGNEVGWKAKRFRGRHEQDNVDESAGVELLEV